MVALLSAMVLLVLVATQFVTPSINLRFFLFRNWSEKRFVRNWLEKRFLLFRNWLEKRKFDWFLSWIDEIVVAF